MALIVFDLDGTLVDSRLDLAESINELLVTHGAPALPADAVTSMIGDGARQLVARAMDAAAAPFPLDTALAEFLAIYHRRLLVHTRPYPGIPEVVAAAAARAPLAVLTNKPGRPTEQLLEAFDLRRWFRWVIGGDAAFPRKPDPTSLRHLMAEAGACASETLMIGDSMVDVDTARAAGTPLCVALYGFGQARGDLVVAPDDRRATDAAALGPIIQAFVDDARRPATV